jgi:hypothetical protein
MRNTIAAVLFVYAGLAQANPPFHYTTVGNPYLISWDTVGRIWESELSAPVIGRFPADVFSFVAIYGGNLDSRNHCIVWAVAGYAPRDERGRTTLDLPVYIDSNQVLRSTNLAGCRKLAEETLRLSVKKLDTQLRPR